MLVLPQFTSPKTVAEARAIQESLRDKLRLQNDFAELNTIGGIDVGYDSRRDLAHASIAVLDYHTLKPLEEIQAYSPVAFPYVPGLLSFREIPAILVALAQLKSMPDMLMVDGQGIAHPRRMGIAAHLGILLDKPSIGVAKSLLTGTYDEPAITRGSTSPLMDKGERIGTVLRSRDRVKPLIISPGHKVDRQTAVEITLHCLTKYRLPEPTRLADKLSKCTANPALC